ncbi:hypothetical protein NHX12_032714 [Muraenolepis orangiensis]|uniref:Uncharacterized protein n=1 Tax=Muraenolepis orangiensis TaxID=630683 RepID=A0A9Q0E659_9TELE|nr:hypothetical protein NHX12_032714 [Muraenolepis orangiensis]
MDLSTGFSVNPLTYNHAEAMDLVKKPEWYRRHTPTCSTDASSPLRARSRMDGSKPEVGLVVPLCPKMEDAICYDDTMDRRNAMLPPQGLGLYHESVHGRLWQAGFYHRPDLTENAATTADSSTGTDSDSGSDVIFLLSASKDSPPCSSVSRESVSPAAAALSLEGEARGCFLLPSALSSQSGESSCSSDSSEGSSVIPVHHARPVVLLSDVKVNFRKFAESPINISSDDDDDEDDYDGSAMVEVSVSADKRQRCVYADSDSDKESASDKTSVRNERSDLRRSPRIKMVVAPVVAAEFTCKVSQHNLRSQVKCDYEDAEVMDYIEAICSSSSSSSFSSSEEEKEEEEEVITSRPKLQLKKLNASSSPGDSSDGSSDNSSDSDDCPSGWQPSKSARPQTTRAERARRKPTPQIQKDTKTVSRNTRLKKTNQKPAKPLPKPVPAPTRKAAPKKAVPGKRRRQRKRRRPNSPPPLFAPGESDILLKYTQPREDKRKKSRPDDFQPYVHLQKRTCTVVNYQEDEESAGHPPCHAAHPGSPPGSLPDTSCYRLGRLSSQSGGQPPLACCLCGSSANAMGLGDLHGPYYPMPQYTQGQVAQRCHSPLPNGVEVEGSAPSTENGEREPRVNTERKEVPVPGRVHGSHGDDDEGVGCVEDDTSSVLAIDSPRVLVEWRPRTDERWIHEDCGVWSTGVFLVKGRLYGLKEASKVAKDVKGCMLNYHYQCAISSGCLLNEENFSMKCSQHKNKVFRSATHHHHHHHKR